MPPHKLVLRICTTNTFLQCDRCQGGAEIPGEGVRGAQIPGLTYCTISRNKKDILTC